eukprot:5734564-Amphidinium_carterae.1
MNAKGTMWSFSNFGKQHHHRAILETESFRLSVVEKLLSLGSQPNSIPQLLRLRVDPSGQSNDPAETRRTRDSAIHANPFLLAGELLQLVCRISGDSLQLGRQRRHSGCFH